MSFLAVDPETQDDLQWSASQPGSMPGNFVSDQDSCGKCQRQHGVDMATLTVTRPVTAPKLQI